MTNTEVREHKVSTIYDYSKLCARIREKFKTQGEYAKKIGCSEDYLSSVLNNQSYFKQSDIDAGVEILEIQDDEVKEYFFSKDRRITI